MRNPITWARERGRPLAEPMATGRELLAAEASHALISAINRMRLSSNGKATLVHGFEDEGATATPLVPCLSALPVQMQLRVEELASANRRKDEFLAVLSHELRSPLSSIRHAVYLLGSEKSDAPARQRAQALIERQVGRMTRLVEEILEVSQITAGRMQLQRERIDLRVIVGAAIETLESEIHLRHHHLTVSLPDSPVWLQGDPGRLEQVLVNLLGNASKYTDPGGELAVRMHTQDGHASVRVRDSGIGIAADALPHIFDLFKRANEAQARCRAGLGIGLALVRPLVELHGGSVTAFSAGPGRGSEFTVRLPVEGGPLLR